MSKKIDLTGQRFGRLVVICENGQSKGGGVLWFCKCDCGAEVFVSSNNLRNGNTRSCGCLQRERAVEVGKHRTTHGMSKTKLFYVWQGILKRTGIIKGANEEHKRDYIDRNITLCDEWKVFENFKEWSLGHGYSEGLQIDRIDNDAGYCPSNCRWVSPKVNNNNRRCTVRLPDGRSLAMFCSEIGIKTCENGKLSKQYVRIKGSYRKSHKIHPDLLKQLRQDVHDQARALYEIAMKRQYIQDKVEDLKKVLNSHRA